MSLRRVAFTCVAPLAISLMASSAQAQNPPPSPEFEKVILSQLDPATRAEVQKRATRGNTVSGVVATILLNNYQKAGPGRPGQGLSVVAVDFVRGAAVIRRAPNAFEVVRFDPKTLRVR